MMITAQGKERYSRQIMIKEIGEDGQIRLAGSKVLVVGAGGLGSAVLYYLAAAGIGTIGIIDDQDVELSNLQRQILHTTSRIGMPKVESARIALQALNPEITVVPYHLRLEKPNAKKLIEQYDIIVTALDNEETRHLVNENCVDMRKPLVEGGVQGFLGRLSTIIPGEGPCYVCMSPIPDVRPKKNSETLFPMFSTTPGVIGVLQANEALKLLLKIGTPLVGRILFYDGLASCFEELNVQQVQECPCCGRS
ncbi:MAG: HesA/MoeB/ThiF family protein [Syntrophaceticus sp.]|nr:HesA/MoeB/ThiF family protein [Syntrophaceticus sp.]MDD3315059.1 HesA/MoeB/ThiF family protein [Syntrophaceticus sp.]MDD4360508.1 HesA/MoeB/ThiF family protein [Syntrophaceticus sp.]MDD4782526.1 HesA/MoeB/ThiF family protein [Syntrophaceticus sp.]